MEKTKSTITPAQTARVKKTKSTDFKIVIDPKTGKEKFETAKDYLDYKDMESEDLSDAAFKGMKEAFAEMDKEKSS